MMTNSGNFRGAGFRLSGVLRTGLLAIALTSVAGLGCSKDPAPTPSAKPAKVKANASAAKSAGKKGAKKAPTFQAPPKSLGAIKVPKNNPMSKAKVELGHKLFFDKRLSADGSRACYSCHLNENGTGGALPTAIGAKGKQLSRHAPLMFNVAYLGRLYWDGRAGSLEAQALGAWKGGNMGVGADNLESKAKEIGALPEYKAAFEQAFPSEGATPTTIAQALASYERTLFCGDTRYDKFAKGDRSALTSVERSGWEIFSGKAQCHSCHTPPMFTDAAMLADGAYHNAGVGIKDKPPAEVDPGRQKVSKSASDHGAFKTPSLRNVTRTAPYFHDGSAATLVEAVSFMAQGGFANENLDVKFKDLKLTETEISEVVAFLGSLTCDTKLDVPSTWASASASASAAPSASAAAPAAPSASAAGSVAQKTPTGAGGAATKPTRPSGPKPGASSAPKSASSAAP